MSDTDNITVWRKPLSEHLLSGDDSAAAKEMLHVWKKVNRWLVTLGEEVMKTIWTFSVTDLEMRLMGQLFEVVVGERRTLRPDEDFVLRFRVTPTLYRHVFKAVSRLCRAFEIIVCFLPGHEDEEVYRKYWEKLEVSTPPARFSDQEFVKIARWSRSVCHALRDGGVWVWRYLGKQLRLPNASYPWQGRNFRGLVSELSKVTSEDFEVFSGLMINGWYLLTNAEAFERLYGGESTRGYLYAKEWDKIQALRMLGKARSVAETHMESLLKEHDFFGVLEPATTHPGVWTPIKPQSNDGQMLLWPEVTEQPPRRFRPEVLAPPSNEGSASSLGQLTHRNWGGRQERIYTMEARGFTRR